jgi:hypothetical protein
MAKHWSDGDSVRRKVTVSWSSLPVLGAACSKVDDSNPRPGGDPAECLEFPCLKIDMKSWQFFSRVLGRHLEFRVIALRAEEQRIAADNRRGLALDRSFSTLQTGQDCRKITCMSVITSWPGRLDFISLSAQALREDITIG